MPDFPQTLALRSILKVLIVVFFTTVFASYVLFQARFVIAGPQITLTEEPTTQHNTRVVELVGTTKNITHLWLNDRPIFTDETGRFDETLVLENGYTIATLRAKDRYGRETELVRSFVYTPVSFIQ
ncbi:MAG: hypothetical protein H6779_01940 [Candidatus Nomurabacteria bacterium]|nr:hypothetical protein [Candidatus Nomurabacteria bacterium]USN88185.1 MAG: hypothetical protein H6779_01940 [Candidatus Nomurabacteria bacterium]